MDLDSILQQALNFAGTFHPKLIIFLFFICLVGEFGIAVPYILETVWLLSGYNMGAGVLLPWQLALLWLSAQAGRQVGVLVLYFLSRFGSMWLIDLYRKYFKADMSGRLPVNDSRLFRWFRKLNYLSPFSIAFARLFWLRIPLTLALGVQRQLRVLLLGVLISSVVWDVMYIAIGTVGGRTVLRPVNIIAYPLIGLTALYLVTFILRRLSNRRAIHSL